MYNDRVMGRNYSPRGYTALSNACRKARESQRQDARNELLAVTTLTKAGTVAKNFKREWYNVARTMEDALQMKARMERDNPGKTVVILDAGNNIVG